MWTALTARIRWSNNFANLGPLENLTAGTYLIRPANTSSNVGFQAATGDSAYDGFINFPTTYGLVLPRILLKNNTTDPALVHEIQSGITVQEIPRKSCKNLPPLTTALLGGGTLEPLNLTEPESLSQEGINDLLGVVAAVAPYNLPIQPEEVAKVDAYLRAAGVSGGQYTPPQDVNYTAVNELIGEQLVATVDSSLELYTNSWGDTLPQYSGNFHEGYYVRSYIALTGYLQLTQDVCIYPQWFGDGAEGLSLEANQSYIMTFPSGKPPVDGFWSITGYNSSSYLIPNPIDVYAVGDRSNLTYPDGALVYGDDDRNDPFSILIQPADIIPPQNWTSNWLPAPARGGDFTVNCTFILWPSPSSYLILTMCPRSAVLWSNISVGSQWLLHLSYRHQTGRYHSLISSVHSLRGGRRENCMVSYPEGLL